MMSKVNTKSFYTRLTQWEHWPTLVYYLPLAPFFLLRSIKAKHPFFYLATNPSILFSGNGTESKYKTLLLIPKKYRPKGALVLKTDDYQTAIKKFENEQLEFPIIAKPDIGFRGYLVKKINSAEALKNYLDNVTEDIIIQEFISHKNELGIFYHRIPGDDNGKISSITIKKFIEVVGDGISTLSELIKKDDRAFLYLDVFENIHKEKINKVYPKGEKIILSEIGNHSKGTQFLNGNHLINNDLENFINQLCKQIDGWYYGRLDIKYKNIENLIQGKDFKILEVNGIISEPTHIYDASYENASFTNAVKTINSHWDIMGEIAIKNHLENGIDYPKILPYIKNMIWLRSYTKKLKKLNKKVF